MGCGTTFVKIILFIANVIFVLAGIALVAAAVTALLALKNEGLPDHGAWVACVVVIVVGVVVFVIAFLGCCGAIMENRAMLITYSVLLIILIILKTILAVLIFVVGGALKEAIKETLEQLFKDHETGVFSKIESTLECCGLEGSKSYNYVPPLSCCAEGSFTCSVQNVFDRGCVEVASDLAVYTYTVVGALCFAIVAIELLAATFGLCLAGHLSNRYKGRY